MFPIIAAVALTGGVVAAAVASSDSKAAARPSRESRESQVAPQSYIVTPIRGSTAASQAAESVPIVENIGRFIV